MNPPKTGKIVNCHGCNKEIYKQLWQLKNTKKHYCSQKCTSTSLKLYCATCSKEVQIPKWRLNRIKSGRVYCNTKCQHKGLSLFNSMENNSRYVGVYISEGYKMIKIAPGKFRAEHVLVMEKHLGRKLKSNEVVHHKDEDRLNNSIDNLQVMTRAEHARHHGLIRNNLA